MMTPDDKQELEYKITEILAGNYVNGIDAVEAAQKISELFNEARLSERKLMLEEIEEDERTEPDYYGKREARNGVRQELRLKSLERIKELEGK